MKMRVILASKSPRRRELLSKIYEDFEVASREVDESLPAGVDVPSGVRILAERKGAAVAKDESDALVISSDTLVELAGVPLGKPRDATEAREMLRSLSGNTHGVHTGVAVHYRGRLYSGTATTRVRFRELSDTEIDEYIATGEPMDKAGAYGIQGGAGKFVLGIEGDFDTVVGLSLTLLTELIKRAVSEGD
ncbi:MAG: septum formation protein Maf [Clostridia bacterium]|nr:septum formation protein Maf [Clostridia bacterium]